VEALEPILPDTFWFGEEVTGGWASCSGSLDLPLSATGDGNENPGMSCSSRSSSSSA
jgi:hypothetical protein